MIVVGTISIQKFLYLIFLKSLINRPHLNGNAKGSSSKIHPFNQHFLSTDYNMNPSCGKYSLRHHDS